MPLSAPNRVIILDSLSAVVGSRKIQQLVKQARTQDFQKGGLVFWPHLLDCGHQPLAILVIQIVDHSSGVFL